MMNTNIVRRIVQTTITFVIQNTILFICAGSISWIWAWIFVATGVIIMIINSIVIPREVIEERGRKKTNVKNWDKVLSTINLFPILGVYIISGLDYRFKWSNTFHPAVQVIGIIFMFLGAMLFTWSMVSNTFFSTMVRIQHEREHKVVTQGPYKFVRHPGYVGFIIMIFATPIALGSLYALPMSLMVSILLIIRTALEDKTLQKELPGYIEYTKNVKYRILPFIW